MKIGVDYYPENWNMELWKRDAEIMAKSGVKLVRIGGLGWSGLEPRSGQFNTGWLDEIIKTFSTLNLEIVLCVPTNCPPLWMYEEHPDIMRTNSEGNILQDGYIGKYCVNSPKYRAYAKRLTETIARRYSRVTSITAWQIDHDIEAYQCCCPYCADKFRNWLLERYDNIQNVNMALGGDPFGGYYTDISQIRPPAMYPKEWRDPSLSFEYMRFSSECAIEFIRELTMIVKKEIPKAQVTTDTSLSKTAPDIYRMYAMLDFASYDNYPTTELYVDGEAVGSNAFYLDMMRGINGKGFWVMEQLSGSVVKKNHIAPAPKPGMLKGYALQALAHGADNVLHFRWRTPLSGVNMFRHGIIGHSNVPSRRFLEFVELCKVASGLNVIDTTELVSDVAIIYSPECDRALKIQPQSEKFSYMGQLKKFHRAFSGFGANVDIVPPTADISRYKAVIAPSLYICEKKATENLYRYVSNGGTLVLTNRSGVKDVNNKCIMEALPTVYKELIGAEVRDYDPIGNGERSIKDFAGNEFTCRNWCDILELTTAKAYAEYNDDFYRCCPAITMNKYCAGVAYYIGTICDSDFYESFVSNIMLQTGIPKLKDLPDGVEVTTRTNGIDEYIFFFNNSGNTVKISLPKAMYSLIDLKGKETLELEAFEVDIVRK